MPSGHEAGSRLPALGSRECSERGPVTQRNVCRLGGQGLGSVATLSSFGFLKKPAPRQGVYLKGHFRKLWGAWIFLVMLVTLGVDSSTWHRWPSEVL